MTATRDRRSDPDEAAEPAWDDRPILGSFIGAPWWGAVALAFVVSAIGAFVDMQRESTLGLIYQICYVGSCAVAICLVRRRSLFGPMVQPPLVFAVTAIGAVLLLGEKTAGGGLQKMLFSVVVPLTGNFPTMAVTTGATVAIGLFRLWWQRDPSGVERPERPATERPARGRREPDEFDDDPFARPVPDRAERPRRDRQPPPAGGRGRQEPPPRRRAPGERSVPPGGDPRAGRGGQRQPRPDREGRPERQRREPNPRGERGRGESGRGEPPAERGGRGRSSRGRQEPPPRRGREGEPPRPRREPPPDGRGRGNPPRPPRRRPPDSQR